MTKSGLPSRLNDIRLFSGSYHHYLEGFEEEVAFARRLARWLNGEGMSVGAHMAIYVMFDRSRPPGQVLVTEFGGDWWQRYVLVGVADGFLNDPQAKSIITQGIIDSVIASAPDQAAVVKDAANVALTHGDKLRFRMLTHTSKRYVAEVTATIGQWPGPSHLVVSLTDRESGIYMEAPSVPLRWYDDVRYLVGRLMLTGEDVILKPKTSFTASLTAKQYDILQWALPAFSPSPSPIVSGLIKLQA